MNLFRDSVHGNKRRVKDIFHIPGASKHVGVCQRKRSSRKNHEGAAKKKKARNTVSLKPKKSVSEMQDFSTNLSLVRTNI